MNYFRNQALLFFISSFILIAVFGLAGCVDLSGSKSYSEKKLMLHSNKITKKSSKSKKPRKYWGEVHTMRGGLGLFSIGMNQLRDAVDKQYNVPAYNSMWYNAGDVSRSIIAYYYRHKNHRPIILMGHSLGANEQIKVARNLNKAGVPVDLLVTVDAVSTTVVPPNVKVALNVYKPGFVPMFSGLRLRAVDASKTRIENVNVNTLKGVKVNHFIIEKDKVVQTIILDKVEKVLCNANRKEA